MSKIKENVLSIYLIKEEFNNHDEIIRDNVISLNTISNKLIYYQISLSDTPQWVNTFFKGENELINALSNSNSRALVLREIEVSNSTRIFAITFGYGKYLLKDDVIEERFGIRMVVNLIGEQNIRSINKISISENNKLSSEQMPKESAIHDFGFDVDGDLINAITGKSNNEESIKGNVSGSDLFKVSTPYNIDNIDEFLKLVYQIYLKEDYKESFGWIDKIKPVNSKELIKKLDELLFEKIVNDDNSIYMAIPELVRFEQIKHIKIDGLNTELGDVELKDVKRSFRNQLKNIDQFKNKYISIINVETDDKMLRFNAYKCFIGEVDYDDKSFTINNGKWYIIEKNYVDEINRRYEEIELSNIDLEDLINNVHEKEYNKSVVEANPSYYYLLDADHIKYGGGHSKVEFCDILTKDKKLIHVKKYGGSSILSHLFNQGVVSAQLLRQDTRFINEVNNKINNIEFKLNSTENYEVIYAIISKYDALRPNIPFFSKVSISNAVKILQSMNYKVSIKRIKAVSAN